MRLLITIPLLFIGGCDLFEPRSADPPDDDTNPYLFIQPTDPVIVLENISNAFPAGNQDYYLDVLTNSMDDELSFAFIPDQGVAQNHVGLFDSWSYAEEEGFISNLFQRMITGGLQSFQWDDMQLIPLDDQTQIEVDYNIQLSLIASGDELPSQLAGRANLTLVQGEDQLYRILSWTDHDISSDTLECWSELKATLQ